jgi:hypothetical protein
MISRSLTGCMLIALALAAGSCNSGKDISTASEAVERFHLQLNNEDYTTIFAQADQRFRNVSPEPDFLAFMTAVHKKLGTVASASRQGFFINYNTSGTQIRLTYATKFTEGDAQEEFVRAKKDSGLALVGYHINSNALVTK